MIIGLTGLAGSGKTTVADYLVEEYGFKKLSFKSGLIDEMKEVFPDLLPCIARAELMDESELFNKKPPLMRTLMQNYGTDVRRGDDPDYWVKKWLKKATVMIGRDNIVVDDVRFLNEADAISMHNGVIVRIVRDGQVNKHKHKSETENKNIIEDNRIVAKEGEHEKIYKMVDKILEEYGKN